MTSAHSLSTSLRVRRALALHSCNHHLYTFQDEFLVLSPPGHAVACGLGGRVSTVFARQVAGVAVVVPPAAMEVVGTAPPGVIVVLIVCGEVHAVMAEVRIFFARKQ